MKDKTNRGSITYFFVFIMIGFMTFAVILVNYARINSQRLNMEMISQSSLDYALSCYNIWLYENYKLFGVSEKDLDEKKIYKIINLESGNNSSHDFEQLKITSHSIEKQGEYTDLESFKKMIVKSNTNSFSVESIEEIAKKLKLFKGLNFGRKIMLEYTQAMKKVGELHDIYIEARNLREEGLENAGNIEYVSIEGLAMEYKAMKGDYSKDARERRNEIGYYFREFRKTVSSMRKLSNKLHNLDSKIKVAILELKEVRKNIINLKKNEKNLVKEYGKSADEMVNQLGEYIDELVQSRMYSEDYMKSSSSNSIAFSKFSKYVDKLKWKKDEDIEEYVDEPSFYSEFEYLELENMIFFNKEVDGYIDLDIFDYLKLFWKIIKGTLMPDNSNFDTEIKDSEFKKLPSNNKIEDKKDFWSFNQNINRNDFKNGFGNMYSMLDTLDLDIEKSNVQKFAEKIIVVDFVKRYFTCNVKVSKDAKISEISKNPLFNSEIEYILHGKRKSKTNVDYTDMQIFAIRFLLNSLNLIMAKADELKSISLIISAPTGEFGYPIIYSVAVVSWASLESFVDLNKLHEGKSVLFIKNRDEFYVDFSLSKIADIIESVNEKGEILTNDVGIGKEGIKMNYRDYLFLLLVVMNEDKMLYRILDAIQTRAESEGVDLNMPEVYSYFSVLVEGEIPMIYQIGSEKFKIKSLRNRGY